MPRRVAADFDAFCRKAFDFLERQSVRDLVIGGLAVIAIGEPRTTGDVHVIAFLTREQAEKLIGRDKDLVDAAGIARRHAGKLDRQYLEETLRPLCDLAEDMTAWRHLKKILRGS